MESVLILNPAKAADIKKLRLLKKTARVVDEFAGQVQELEQVSGKKVAKYLWVYYPWHNTLVKILPEKDFTTVRLSRNRDLITFAEQKKFAKIRVAFAGLNVGNPGAVCASLEGGSDFMRLADFDPLSLSNLNRFRAGLPDLGVNKAVLTARQIWEANPYAKIEVWGEGIMPGEEEKFLEDVDVLVEEIDFLPMKVTLRNAAKKKKVSVVMVTGNDAGLILDVERYDINPNLPILNGFLNKGVVKRIVELSAKTPVREKILLARDFIGKKLLHPRLNKSFEMVNYKLAGIPQLAEASFLRGAVLAFVVRQIALGARMPSGRYELRLDKIIISM